MNEIIGNDHETTKLILKMANSLRINNIVDMLHNTPDEKGDVEFLPIIHTAKDCLEKTLRCFVLLGSWAREESIKIRAKSDEMVSKIVLEGLKSINISRINYFKF